MISFRGQINPEPPPAQTDLFFFGLVYFFSLFSFFIWESLLFQRLSLPQLWQRLLSLGTLSFFWLVFVCWHDQLYKVNRRKIHIKVKKSQEIMVNVFSGPRRNVWNRRQLRINWWLIIHWLLLPSVKSCERLSIPVHARNLKRFRLCPCRDMWVMIISPRCMDFRTYYLFVLFSRR